MGTDDVNPEPIRVLHVDDEPGFGELVATHLEREHDAIEVVTATSARRGLDRLAADGTIDCIVSDYEMPGMDGLAFLETVRKNDPDLPFVLFTGRGSEAIASEAITAGVSEYLDKAGGTEQYAVLANRVDNLVTQNRAERELAAANARFRSLTENVGFSVITINEENVVQYANDAVAEMFGYTPAEMVGESLDLVVPERLERTHFEAVTRYLREGDRRLDWEWVELTARHRDGHEFPVGISFGEHVEDGEHLFTGVIRDITERKQRDRELERQNERLEEFAGVISHDLRNPLRVASGYLDLARGSDDADHLTKASDALDRMETIIEDMLVLAREGKAIGETEPIALCGVVEEAWENVETADAELRCVGLGDGNAPVEADASRLGELFENLFRNAIEHASGTVTVRVGCSSAGFYVEDTGPGIPADERETVFEHGYSTREEGTGLGLAIVRRIVEAHGWSIAVGDTDGGARFEVTT